MKSHLPCYLAQTRHDTRKEARHLPAKYFFPPFHNKFPISTLSTSTKNAAGRRFLNYRQPIALSRGTNLPGGCLSGCHHPPPRPASKRECAFASPSRHSIRNDHPAIHAPGGNVLDDSQNAAAPQAQSNQLSADTDLIAMRFEIIF